MLASVEILLALKVGEKFNKLNKMFHEADAQTPMFSHFSMSKI